MDPSYFNALFPELRETISSQVYNLQIAERVCAESITQDEVNTAINQQKITGGLHRYAYHDNSDGYFFIIDLDILNMNNTQRTKMSTQITKPGLFMLPGLGGPNFTELGFNYDLLMIHNVYANRLNCRRIFPGLAKEQTMKQLDGYIEIFDSIKDHEILTDIYVRNLMFVYSYLYMNSYVFNISSQANLNKFSNIPANIKTVDINVLDDINQDIEYMIEELRKKICSL